MSSSRLCEAIASSSRTLVHAARLPRHRPGSISLISRSRISVRSLSPSQHASSSARFFSSSRSSLSDPQPSRYSKFDTSMKSDVRDSSIDPNSPTVLSNIVNADEGLLTITKFSEHGIQFNDGTVTRSGVLVLGGQVFGWDVQAPVVKSGQRSGGGGGVEGLWKEWTEDRFALLELVTPKPEILLFGTGSRPLPVPQRMKDSMSKLGISLDVMDSRNAASTFNLLQEEGRQVGLALCPLVSTAS
ncbi:NADH dehydrogenase 1 alpha subcomplex assembly factor 3 [Kockovaella imperatae]|uniref:NADH dehydrogenase 1 alpha subcomplex assembly factor 3 n=1 Tax=Kockovaella imperatae TaxID=4999 RepID=A0A1Y1UID9_9TREE|nr:NADH dehydrogenase 1 alpha subcomplex assembly factor 3 [Kockovaella imperatae]ORX37811.1 NADH dehydrogenase 1 alpha subcomplex assembly factor 3 [Kockovaella imperatae]